MREQLFDDLAVVEEKHWWHRSRLEMVAEEIRRMDLPEATVILDLGCGTGGTTRFLERYGRVIGIDYSELTIEHTRRKVSTAEVQAGDANAVERYSLRDFRTFFRQLDLEFVRGRYFNAISYPACLALALRHRFRRTPVDANSRLSEMAVPSERVNGWLIRYMRLENRLYQYLPLPFGVSLLAVGRKR